MAKIVKNAPAPSPLSASAFYKMYTTLLVIKTYTPCCAPLFKTLQPKSMDYYTNSQ